MSKRPVAHTLFAWLMLVVFLHGSVGGMLLSWAGQWMAREAMEASIREGGATDVLVLTETAWHEQVSKSDDRDFLYKGTWYDLVRIEKRNGLLYVHCSKDGRETDQHQLAQQLNADFTTPAQKAPHHQKAEDFALHIFSISTALYLPTPPEAAASAPAPPPDDCLQSIVLPAFAPPPETVA